MIGIMEVTEKIKQAIYRTENYIRIMDYCKQAGCEFLIRNISYARIYFKKNGAEIVIEANTIYTLDGVETEDVCEFQFKVGIATPKGYFSTKKIPVIALNNEDLTESELTEFMNYYSSETKDNTFDPRWHEHQLQRRNANGWSVVASKLQPDCRN